MIQLLQCAICNHFHWSSNVPLGSGLKMVFLTECEELSLVAGFSMGVPSRQASSQTELFLLTRPPTPTVDNYLKGL
eukprot:scaffold10302_cov118-Cylindrotheca_fusiformis.AAC.6